MREMIRRLVKNPYRRIFLIAFDAICVILVNVGFFGISSLTSAGFSTENIPVACHNIALLFCAIALYRIIFCIYTNIWRYTSSRAYFDLVLSDGFAGIAAWLLSRILGITIGIWYYIAVTAVITLVTLSSRFAYRLICRTNDGEEQKKEGIRVAILGAGELGASLCEDLRVDAKSTYHPVLFVDSDASKCGGQIRGIPVVMQDEHLPERLRECAVQEVFIAVRDLDSDRANIIYNLVKPSGCKLKIYDLPVQDFSVPSEKKQRTIRDFSIEDLLSRTPLQVTDADSMSYYTGKTVLITGGGGSIGSELCRQVAGLCPKQLIIFDIYENNAYEIQQELLRTYGNRLDLRVEIGSVREYARLESIFANYRPQVVFHAAAHKHVPLMEQSGREAILNNVFGTWNAAELSEKYGAEKFILISTDKAVNPTNIMGASKRLCEMVIQCRGDSATNFAAVRFGNVLGSNGSVIPLFKRQIASGGPVTVTDRRIIRYFMTIPEASQLVMLAGLMAKSGELFVLDMGKPVCIYDLAVNMIRLSGLEPGRDIEIREIGLRPGEKLYEELLMNSEKQVRTDNELIFVERDTPLTREAMEEILADLRRAVEESTMELGSDRVRACIARVVPTFCLPEKINAQVCETGTLHNER